MISYNEWKKSLLEFNATNGQQASNKNYKTVKTMGQSQFRKGMVDLSQDLTPALNAALFNINTAIKSNPALTTKVFTALQTIANQDPELKSIVSPALSKKQQFASVAKQNYQNRQDNQEDSDF